ncbi:MAG: threonylcarbamoyl-AMP synthase [Clostridia bacterium]|nr:threonylcarbamoyl-AMP synthase [Clostridia bacterium]MBQ8398791.1 threonylcarbamoyl-AMP synthase [Clostridia bacterium]
MKTEIIYSPTESALSRAASVLKNGGLVAFPTETVYGLGGHGLCTDSADKIYAAKGRPTDNPLILHLASADEAEKYAYTCPMYYKLAMAFMPGPLTVILPKKEIVPDRVTGGLDTVALRVPAHPVASALLKRCDFPIAAPSANTSGRPSPTEAEHVIEDLDGRIDMIVAGGSCEIGVESTIVSIDGEHLTLLRPGAITPEMLSCFCEELTIDPSLERPLLEGERPLAPGMKYRHYAPKAQVVLLEGSEEDILAFMKEQQEKAEIGLLCSDEQFYALSGKNVISYGKNQQEEAQRLFACLREFDRREHVKTIYAPKPQKDGVGLAVYNRLAKAAGFTVKKVKEQ